MNTKHVFRKILIVAALGATCGVTFAAGTASATMGVSTTVNSNCLISTTALAFPVYDPTAAADTTSSSTITVKCNKNSVVSIAINGGSSASDTARTMLLTGQDPLNYALYSDAAYLKNWGTTAGAQSATGTGLNSGVVLTVHGKIFMNQYTAGVGTYNDTVTATVTY